MGSNKGFILLPLLLFFHLILFFGLINLNSILSVLTQSHLHILKNNYQPDMIIIMRSISRNLVKEKYNCRVKAVPAFKLMQMPLSWWEKYTCSGNFARIRYYYIVEELGSDACAIITLSNRRLSIASYERITILFQFDKFRGKNIWQVSFVNRDDNKLPCFGQKHAVNIGIQGFRELV